MVNLLSVVWDVDPVFISLGGLDIRYYGLTWALAFGISMVLFTNFVRREGYPEKMFDSIFWFATLSTIIGARLGHCLFYEPGHYLSHPGEILNLRQGGLASHGAAIGLLVGLYLFSKRNKMKYLWSLDRIMVAVAISGALIRLGNLFNSEIYGVETPLPWGFVFMRAGETAPKHPTQIYEALSYLVIFALLLWQYYKQDLARRRPGFMFGTGVGLIFVARFFIEYIKNPQESFEVDMSLLMGQWLSIPFILLGLGMVIYAVRRPALHPKPIQEIELKQKKKKK